MASNYIDLPVEGGGGGGAGVDSIDGLSGALTLSSNTNSVVITPIGTNIDLNAWGISNAVIFQPGGTAGGNVYTSWAALYVAISALGIAAIDVCFDNTFAPIVIPAGTYALGNTTFQAPVGQAPANPVTVILANGCVFSSFPIVSQLVNMVSVSASPVYTVSASVPYFIDVLRAAMLTNVSGAPMIDVPAGGQLYIALESLTSMTGAVGFPVIRLNGDANLIILLAEGATLSSDTISGGASTLVNIIVNNPAASFSTSQTNLSGAITVSYNPLISNIAIGNGLGDIAYATAAGNGITLPANATTSKLFLSQTGTGSAGQAPVWSLVPPGSIDTSGLSASQAVFTDSSKNLVSKAVTGSGNVVLSAAPTLTGTAILASANISGTVNMSGLSASQAVVTDGSKNLASMVYTSTVTNSSIASRDSNGNAGFNNSSNSVTAVASSGQTITMSAGSAGRQRITGTSTATFNLPDCTTLINGWPFYFNNSSTGTVTINRQDGSTLVYSLGAGGIILVVCVDNSTVQGVWQVLTYLAAGSASNTAGTTLPGLFTAANITSNGALTTAGTNTLSALNVAGTVMNSASGVLSTSANIAIGTLGITIDGGGSAPSTGQKGYIFVPYACTINSVTLLADQSGSCVIDIWKVAYGSFPPNSGNTITASAIPTLSGAQKSQDTTLTGWTTSISAGDVLAFNVNSASTLTRVNLILKVTKT